MNMKIYRYFSYFLVFSTSILRGLSQEIEPPTIDEAEDPTEETVEMPQKGIEYVWRTSDLPGETPVLRQQRWQRKADGSGQLPEGSVRVGCVCMDYHVLSVQGRGACGGHNGVRFWLYVLPSGDTVKIATLRHESHPDTLSDASIFELAAYKRYERQMAQKQLTFYETLDQHPEWLDNVALKPNPVVYPTLSDSLRLVLSSPGDKSAQNTLLYSLSVLLGSGGLYLLKKLTGIGTDMPPNDDVLPEAPKGDDLI